MASAHGDLWMSNKCRNETPEQKKLKSDLENFQMLPAKWWQSSAGNKTKCWKVLPVDGEKKMLIRLSSPEGNWCWRQWVREKNQSIAIITRLAAFAPDNIPTLAHSQHVLQSVLESNLIKIFSFSHACINYGWRTGEAGSRLQLTRTIGIWQRPVNAMYLSYNNNLLRQILTHCFIAVNERRQLHQISNIATMIKVKCHRGLND